MVMKLGARSIVRAAVLGVALLGLGGCYYAPGPYAYAPGAAYAPAPAYYPGYYYGPSVGVSFGDGNRHWR
jgi:hypothetical protein